MARLGLSALLAVLAALPAAAQPIARADLKPGLVFTATEVAYGKKPFTVSRVEPTVALNLAAGEAPHPRSAGGFQFHWRGYINIFQPGKYRFDAIVAGGLVVEVAGKAVLTAAVRGEPKRVDGPEVELAAGFQPFDVTLTRLSPAVRLELIWRGPGFRPEPVPYFFFGHLPEQRPAEFAADLAREHGRFLFEELACVRCHKPDAADKMAKTLAERTGPGLTEIGRRAYPGWLDAWLADPHKLRPDTAMPRLFADDAKGRAERYAVVAYLVSLGGPVPERERRRVNLGEAQRSVVNGQRLFVTAGCAACHGDKLTGPSAKKDDPDADDKPVLKPEDSVYAAGTAGPAGQYRLGSPGSKTTPEALAKYLQDPLAVTPHGRMPNMTLSGQEALDLARFLCRQTDEAVGRGMPEEPKLNPTDVAGPGGSIGERWRFARMKRTDQWKEAGRMLFAAKGCANCHAVGSSDTRPGEGRADAPRSPGSLADLCKSAGWGGCLAEKPEAGKVPVYALDAKQRADLAAFLKDGLSGPGSPAPAYQARLALRRFNCLNCHNRDGEGGIPPDLAERMRLLDKAENADDVAPPRLTGVGHKLRASWFQQVLTQRGRARPWMTLRMPQYGEANIGFLADAVPKLEGTTPDDAVGKVNLTAAKVQAGRTLAGKEGLGCVSCHDISGIPTGGTRGPDLATTQRRVRLDWYVRWMHQPQRLAPGTRMPQNFEDGKSQLKSVLGGDADAQVEALWAYLSLGLGLPLPAGIEPPGKALVVAVKDRPEVLRTFMPDGAGTRAIAVGYPGGVNLTFDASQCRLSYAWTGNFLDASPVWTGRGGNPARLLGPKFWEGPPGFPWAVTDSRTPPDFLKRAEDPAYGFQPKSGEFYGYDPKTDPPTPERLGTWLKPGQGYLGSRLVRFAGYALDAGGAPTFRYTLTDEDGKPRLTISEKPSPLPVSVAAGLRRTFAVDLPADKTAWLLVAVAAKDPRAYSGGKAVPLHLKGADPEVPAAGTRLVVPAEGDRAAVVDVAAAPAGSAWHFAPRPGGGWVVLLRLPESDAPAKADVSLLVWGLPRDDEELVKGLKGK